MIAVLAVLTALHGNPAPMTELTFQELPAVWQCIAFHESTDNIYAVNPITNDKGAFQFDSHTWAAYAPVNYPLDPTEATLGMQYQVAENLELVRGFEPWQTASLCGV